MTLVEIVGNQHLRILALEETVGQLQNENSRLQERIVQLTPKDLFPQGIPENVQSMPAAPQPTERDL